MLRKGKEKMSFFKLGKVKLPHRKGTAEMPAVKMTPPSEVLIPVSQHIGAPANPVVKAGDKVYVGTLVAEATGYVSSPIYSSVSGTVKKIEPLLTSSGRVVSAIRIESDGEMTVDPAIAPPEIKDFESFSAAVRNSGLVGLGGAGFPTSVKLDAEKKGLIKKIILNGAECEPYITSDTRTMVDDSDYLKLGVHMLEKYISADEIIIGIEKNKPAAIETLTSIFKDDSKVRIAPLPETYPQGAEKILIFNTTGLVVPEGGLPSDAGCLVLNVTSVAFMAKYAETGIPLVEKRITVDGSAVRTPMNVIVPIGTPIEEVIAFTGGFKEEPGKVLYGGPMMGVAVYSLSDPVLKNTNAIVALNKKDALKKEPDPCIHCGRCVEACPMALNPTLFARSMNVSEEADRIQRLKEGKINLCIECGCCSFVCPSRRPLVDKNRAAKAEVRAYDAKKSAGNAKIA